MNVSQAYPALLRGQDAAIAVPFSSLAGQIVLKSNLTPMGRRWGQHFLRSESVIGKILEAARLDVDHPVLEIGPGEGVVTSGLCARSQQVHVYEIDPELCQKLREREDMSGLTIHEGDFLTQDLRPLASLSHSWKVVANLPYYITAPILERLFWQRAVPLESAVLMMQDEVARRVCCPATREAGAITYIVGAFFALEYLFQVPPSSFAPPPKVDSAVIRVTPLAVEGAAPQRAKVYERLVSTAFGQRRKQLGSSLRSSHKEAGAYIERAGIDPMRRPETLTVEEFWSLARIWPDSV